MTALIGVYLYGLALLVVYVVIRDHRTGECDLLSVRNVALLGFIIFQLTSGGTSLITGFYGRRAPLHPVATGLEYAFMATVFLFVLMWAYRRGWAVRRLAARVPVARMAPSEMGMIVMAIGATAAAVFFRLGVQIPLVYKVADYVGSGFAAVACGCVGWVWGRRLLNPACILYALVILAANAAVVMQGAFGRRGLVAVGGALLWGMYYAAWRSDNLGTLIRRLSLLSIGPIIFVALFTSVRKSGDKDRSAAEHFQLMTSAGDLKDGFMDLLYGQEAGPISMWLIETHPEEFEYRHLMTVRFFLVFPVPRDWWPDKPVPMAKLYVNMARIRRVAKTLNVGPGIIGSAACEGGLYALVIYAILGGLFLRFFDETVRLQPTSPIIVLPVGAALGQILALARGESSSFAAAAVFTMVGTLIITFGVYKVLETSGLMLPLEDEWNRLPGSDAESDDGGDDDPYWDPDEPEDWDEHADGVGAAELPDHPDLLEDGEDDFEHQGLRP